MRIRRAVLVLASALLPVLAFADPGWSLRVAAQDPVIFRGLAAGEGGGQAGGMVYPAPGLVGLMAAVVTHGVIVNSMRDHARTASEKRADKVLDPYRPDLDHFTQQELALAALAQPGLQGVRLGEAQDPAADGKVVASLPLFYMTPGREALVLDNSVEITRPGAQPYRNTVRVVSALYDADSLKDYWGADQAKALKTESARLLALSLEIALAQAGVAPADADPAAYRTVRYRQGNSELFERAQVLDERCGRALLRNLRGWLMSVPLAKAPAGDAACPADAAR